MIIEPTANIMICVEAHFLFEQILLFVIGIRFDIECGLMSFYNSDCS